MDVRKVVRWGVLIQRESREALIGKGGGSVVGSVADHTLVLAMEIPHLRGDAKGGYDLGALIHPAHARREQGRTGQRPRYAVR